MKNKAPGNDGLSVEFYVMFWQKLGPVIWKAMLQSHKNGYLYKSARRGLISLIPKKNKDPLEIKNWQPLTLLNVDCKIVTKMLANRLKHMLKYVIGEQQSGYVPERFIGINIRKMLDLLTFVEQEQIPAVLIAVDFEKCFDSINHDALFQSLRYFNISEYYISWVMMVY